MGALFRFFRATQKSARRELKKLEGEGVTVGFLKNEIKA